MRLVPLFRKTMIENFRDWKITGLTLTFASFFVLLMFFSLEDTSRTYEVVFVNLDGGVTGVGNDSYNAGEDLILNITSAKNPDGTAILHVSRESDMAQAQKSLIDGSADLVVEIPENFSRTIMDYREGKTPTPAIVRTLGNPSNANYLMAATYCDGMIYSYTIAITGMEEPLLLQADIVSSAKSLNAFELSVPALLILALMMLMFTAAASIIREKDKGTIIRLQMSNMRFYEFLISISLTQIIIGLLAFGLTFVAAFALGYHAAGSMTAALVIAALSSLAVVAISLIVAAFLRSIYDLMTVGCIPFFILMFFSGGFFPLPGLRLFTVGGHSVYLGDILPTTHSISAMDKILNCEAGLSDLGYEILALVVLTGVYFAAGMWLLGRRYMRTS